MNSGLRPLTSLEVLDAAWLLLRRHWAVMYASSGLGTAPLALALMAYFYWLGTLVVGTEDSVFYTGTLVWSTVMALAWALNCLARGAVTAGALAAGRGETVTFGGCWRAAWRRGLGSVFVGVVAFAAAWIAGGCFVAPGLILAFGWWVARPVALTEERPFAASLRRSWALTDGYRGKSAALWGLSCGLWLFAALNLHLLLHFLVGTAAGVLGIDTGGIQPYFQVKNQQYLTVLAAVAFVLVDPLKTCMDAILYLDLRIRREGVDLEERLRALRQGIAALGALGFLLLASGAVQAKSLEDYARRVREVRELVERAPDPQRVDSAAVGDLRYQLVEMPGGQKLTVRNDWLTEGLASWKSGEDKAALVRRLKALERSLGAPSAPVRAEAPEAPVDTRQALQQVLSEPEFQPLAERTELQGLVKGLDLSKSKTWWQSFLDWIKNTLFKSPPPPKVERPRWQWDGGETLVYVLLGVVVLLLLALLVKWIIERPIRQEARAAAVVSDAAPSLEASATENALDHTVDEWELFAREWLGRGDVRQAIRALYLATLVHLHRERLIEYNRAFTNWIYVRQFRGDAERKSTLRALTQTFDEVWYGERPCDEEHYYTFEQRVRALGTPAPSRK
jgi:hypothetical protein